MSVHTQNTRMTTAKLRQMKLNGEKIDVINWSDDPAHLIANALSPAEVLNVEVIEEERLANVIVPDDQLSLAIGNGGQNVRLAAHLTGWKIDIRPESGFWGEDEEEETEE